MTFDGQFCLYTFLLACALCGSAYSALVRDTLPVASSAPAYLVSSPPGAITRIHPLWTVGEAIPHATFDNATFHLVGNVDGMGVRVVAADRRLAEVVIVHELSSGVGVQRAHGQPGAFVTRIILDRRTLQPLGGETAPRYCPPRAQRNRRCVGPLRRSNDNATTLVASDLLTESPGRIDRLCSATLRTIGNDDWFLAGEESFGNARALAFGMYVACACVCVCVCVSPRCAARLTTPV